MTTAFNTHRGNSVGWVAAFNNPTSAINHLNGAMLNQVLQTKPPLFNWSDNFYCNWGNWYFCARHRIESIPEL